MAFINSASRYNSFDSRSSTQSSHQSDPSSSTELKLTNQSRALVRTKSHNVAQEKNLSAMVKKFMDRRSNSSSNQRPAANRTALVIPADLIADDLKKTARKGSNFTGLHRKLFGKGSSKLPSSSSSGKKDRNGSEVKALMEVKTNTRTLAMVLRSERELLSQNKDQEAEITELKLILEEKNREVEKLKDLCLKQREEIKTLKSAVLFPDVMNSQLHALLENQGSELKHAKQLIPSLQRQVTSLTGQLHCLAEDLAEVKADKYSARNCYDSRISSPRTPADDQEEASNSLEFSSEEYNTPGSPDDMFLKDLNPCLTPYYAMTKSKDFEALGYEAPKTNNYGIDIDSRLRKPWKSSDCSECSKSECASDRGVLGSEESKCTYGNHIQHLLF